MYKLKSSKPAIQIDTDWIEKGTKCWIFNPLDDSTIFMKGKVFQFKPATYTPSASTVICQLEASNKIQIPILDVYQRNESTAILSNLTDLQIINNPEILFQLNERFRQKNIFTFIGSNLLIINPYQLIPECFGDEMIDRYYNSIFLNKMTYKDEQPHIYGMTSEILKNISLQNQDQVIIISGQSGSGKTQTNKYCLKYLTNVCHKFTDQKQEHVQNIQIKILNCNPLLESFGNAKTVKNDNSSRFGKLTALKIHSKQFYIKQTFIRSYFLEKSRVTLRNMNEHNFHIFYYLVDGIPSQERSKYYIQNQDGSVMTINDFYYLKTSERIDQYKNLKLFNEVNDSMKVLGLNDNRQDIWRAVMGILHLGNFMFDETTFSEQNNGSPCQIIDSKGLKNTAQLFGISAPDLQKSILFYKRKGVNQQFFSAQNKRKCQQTRDSISKAIYQSLFLWIINKLNTTLSSKKSQSEPNFYYLKLLDIYGFQVFEQNGFEQLAVNYTNQRLHQIYIRQIFKQQKQMFKQQGIQSAIVNLKFADNTGVIDLIDTSPTSIYNLIDQSCTVETKDDVLLNNIRKTHLEKSLEYFPESNKTLVRKSFIINHTPGTIEYDIQGFRDKNKDFVRQDIIELFSYSTNTVLNQTFKYQQKFLLNNKAKRFLSQKLRQQINDLMSQLEAGTHVHFVRCIKPNDYKQPFTFVPKMALNQIKYLGLLDTILLRRATYHIKMPYQNFYKLYSAIDFSNSQLPIKQKTKQLFKKYFMGRGVDHIFGATKIFLKQDSKPIIDKLFNDTLKRIKLNIHVIQSYVIVPQILQLYEIQRKQYKSKLSLQIYLTNFIYQIKQQKAAKTLQKWWSKLRNQTVNKRKRKGCIVVQKYFRRLIYSLNFDAITTRVTILQRYLLTLSKANIYQSMQKFKKDVMNDIMDLIWDKAIMLKLNTLEKYFTAMSLRLRQKQNIQIINKQYKQRMGKRIKIILSNYLPSLIPCFKTQQYLKATRFIQKSFRSFKIRKLFLSMRKSAIIIQRIWRQYYGGKQQNIKFCQKLFFKQNQNKRQTLKNATQILFKSKRLKNNTVQSFLSDIDTNKTNKIYMFYYLLDYDLIVDPSLIYPDNSWINNYYYLFKESFQRGNHLQMVSVGEAHTLASNTSKIYSWGWNDYNQLGISDKSINSTTINTLNLPTTAKVKYIQATSSYSAIAFLDPPSIHYFGKIQQNRQFLNNPLICSINKRYTVTNGQIFEVQNKLTKQIYVSERITSICCGSAHVVAKSHLKRIFTWGNGQKGQLGLGDYFNKQFPTLVDLCLDSKDIKIIQISAGYSSTLLLLSNHKLYWFGTSALIQKVNKPIEVQLQKHSNYVWDHMKYTPVRISSSWSRTMSIHGVTFAFHHGAMSTNISLKKKVISMLSTKWQQSGSNNILPPYIPSIAKYFTQKSMKMPNFRSDIEMQSRRKLKQLREAIQQQLNSFKVTDHQGIFDETFMDKYEQFQ